MLVSSPLNKLVSWLDLAIPAASMLLLLCPHGEGEFEVAMGPVLFRFASRGRRVLLPTSGCTDWSTELLFAASRWSGSTESWVGVGFLFKLVLALSLAMLVVSVRHGGGREGGLVGVGDLQLGSMEAAPGSVSMAVDLRLPLNMVERRPLPPLASASATSGRRFKVMLNLLAFVPSWRPFSSAAAGSRYLTPSGFIPSGDVLGGDELLRCGGDGAGPDSTSPSFRVRSANCLNLLVIFYFLWSSLYNATVINERF